MLILKESSKPHLLDCYTWFTKRMTAGGDLVLVMAGLCGAVEMMLYSDLSLDAELVNKETKCTSERREG